VSPSAEVTKHTPPPPPKQRMDIHPLLSLSLSCARSVLRADPHSRPSRSIRSDPIRSDPIRSSSGSTQNESSPPTPGGLATPPHMGVGSSLSLSRPTPRPCSPTLPPRDATLLSSRELNPPPPSHRKMQKPASSLSQNTAPRGRAHARMVSLPLLARLVLGGTVMPDELDYLILTTLTSKRIVASRRGLSRTDLSARNPSPVGLGSSSSDK